MSEATKLLTSHKKFHINLGLDRISKILALLNNPQNNYKTIHIAGTNGKGSTSKIINEILIEHFKTKNKKIGLFTSPHLFKYEERIKVNDVDIPSDDFNKLINKIDSLAIKNKIELSEFELITAVAFYYFSIQKVDYVVLEVGLGGMFDATNVVKPIFSIITTIDFDHTERLGKTIEEIALQKAGIIKNNTPLIISKENLGYSTIKKIAFEKNAKILEIPDVKIKFNENNYAIFNNKKYIFNLLGSHQAQNLALALALINNFEEKIEENTLENALRNVSWKFRLEYKNNIIIDGAHNPSGIRVLRNFLNENFKNTKKRFVFGCLKNKDYKTMLKILLDKEDEFLFYEFDYPNSLKFNELDEKYQKIATKITSIDEIKNSNKLTIYCGSLYMLGKIFS